MNCCNSKKGLVLVTGATGYLGQRIVRSLLADGFLVRALSRSASSDRNQWPNGVEGVDVDLTDEATLERAFDSVDFVVHAAAAMENTESACQSNVRGTLNIVNLCLAHNIQKAIYISSLSVYEIVGTRSDELIHEGSSLEHAPEKRGYYSLGKYEAERIFRERLEDSRLNITILRPGIIVGDGELPMTPQIGKQIGSRLFVTMGSSDHILPFVHVLTVSDAIVACLNNPRANGTVFNVIDERGLTKRQYLQMIAVEGHVNALVMSIPLFVIKILVAAQKGLFSMVGRRPLLTHYRLVASQKPVKFDATKLTRELGFKNAHPLSGLALTPVPAT